jgi:uncharacterized membrane protein
MPILNPVSVLLEAFPDPRQASDVLHELSQMQRDKKIQILGAGSITHDKNGKFHTAHANPDISDGTLLGLMGGLFVGLLGGPVGFFATLGAASGGLMEHLARVGFTRHQLEKVKEALPPGTAAVFAIVYDNRVAAVQEAMTRLAGAAASKIIQVAMKAEVASQLRDQFREAQEKELAESAV